jgi:hypothetical protein
MAIPADPQVRFAPQSEQRTPRIVNIPGIHTPGRRMNRNVYVKNAS